MTSPFFSGVPQREISTAGITLLVPGFYPDVRLMSALFTVDLAAARRLLPNSRYKPLSPWPGQALLAIHCFEYRGSPVGDYHEVSLAIGVQLDASPRPSLLTLAMSLLRRRFDGFVAELPVSTEIARVAGVELFDYPKFLADIRFEEDARHRRCVVRDADTGELIYGFCGEKLRTRQHDGGRVTCYRSYPMRADGPERARMHLNALERGTRLFGGVEVETGKHARSEALATLAPLSPLLYEFVPRAEAILEAPEPF